MKRALKIVTICLLLLSLLGTTALAHTCVDQDRDYWCDDCGMLIYHTCVDRNKDTWCDLCSCWIKHDCYDRNGDHECDQCGKLMNVNINIHVTGYLDENYTTTVYFYEGTYPSVFKTLSSSTGTITFSCAAKSYFTLAVIKFGHPTRNFSYNTDLTDINIDAKLYPYGDASQDGKVNVGDVSKIYAHIRDTDRITDDYALLCADASGDGKLNMGDVASIYAHIRGTKPLF